MKRLILTTITALFSIALLHSTVEAQKLINYLPEGYESQLTPQQQHYLDKALDSRFARGFKLATIDLSYFEQEVVVFHYNDVPYTAIKEPRRGVPSQTRISWIGRLEGWNGMAHIVYNKADNMVVGMIEAEHVVFLIRPLGDGIHAIVDWDMTAEEGCQVPDGRDYEYQGANPAVQGENFGNSDIMAANESNGDGGRATGECNVRVLVAYSDDVDANVADILMDINNMVNLANTGYMNSESSPGGAISMRIELAMAYEVSYVESGDMQTDLDCITNTGDGCLDDIHTQRSLWRADQCVLLTENGSGLAWVSTDYEDQFSVTGRGNFMPTPFIMRWGIMRNAHTLLNQSTQPGTAPYAGWGEPTTGCFRTVLAYGDACGTGACPRQNIFSDDDSGQWNCGGNNYTPGTSNNRNQDRLDISGPIIVAHQTVPTSVTYGSDYNWNAREAVHFAASSDVGYSSSTNNFELFSGSEGSFRAANSVTLGEGFWARSGSEFTAYLENCNTLARLAGDEDRSLEQLSDEPDPSNLNVEIYPNPFGQSTTVKYFLPSDSEVYISLTDAIGRSHRIIKQNGFQSSGWYDFEISGTDLSAGVYRVTLVINDLTVIKKIIKVSP